MFDTKTGAPLARRVRITYGIRFDAAERLRRIENLSLAAISLLTGYIIIGSAGQALLEAYLTPLGNRFVVFSIIGISIIVLILSLTEAKARAVNSAAHLEKNAQDICELHTNLVTEAALGTLNGERYKSFVAEYNELLTSYIYNQRLHDFEVFMDRNIVLFPEKQGFQSRAILKVRAVFGLLVTYWMYLLAIFGVPVAALWLFLVYAAHLVK
ncbi:MAG: SLATT domain-containing protein [Caulobacter sp.]|nr:SLATT domain-containing protein [Caulobacter sp.]